MEEDEIICIKTDDINGITHVGLKKGGLQSIDVILHLLHGDDYSFHTIKDGIPKEVYHKYSTEGKKPFLTIDPNSSLMDTLNFLPECP